MHATATTTRRRRGSRWAVVAAAAITAGCAHLGVSQSNPAAPAPATGSLAGLLAQVRIVDQINPVPGYDRGCGKGHGCVFGAAWNDPLDHSGCDTRNRLLHTALQDIEYKPGTRDCKVIAGRLVPDPYTGQAVDLKHVAVDHIVPLKAAWDAGAAQWDLQQRRIFANDMAELVAVSSSANSSKGESTPSEWLPAIGKCPYVIRYLTVTVKYHLPITIKDRAAATAACQTD
ncbi:MULTISPECIES: HNH endonuclease family protein [Mycobacterium]|uniref:HNH endonuclease n=1 Tax=Mycobacterium paraffinicum TaxID=53378 RepID=A0A1Q4HP66_9MYCO|nr:MULTISPECIES: HNH endonuclease family protein [Mycobacterium]OCB26059.1 hypothetical protein A5689_11645 [Mycobacterium intracellulare subsp. yongonense]OJZ69489.1 HNH endonuclease [Mycobacterium paraffinicum]